jgi:hypothetical protein
MNLILNIDLLLSTIIYAYQMHIMEDNEFIANTGNAWTVL